MARQKISVVVCDGCGKQFEEGSEGSATVFVDVVGSEFTRRLDLDAECAAKLPEGTKRKRPVRLTDEEKAAKEKEDAAAKKAA